MNIQKFRGPTLQDAVEAIRQQWGPEAMVLHVERQKTSRPFFGKAQEWVEVTARPPETPTVSRGGARLAPPASIFTEINSLRDEIHGVGATIRQLERVNWARAQVENKTLDHPMLNFLIEKGLDPEMAMELLAEWSARDSKLDLDRCMTDLDRRLPRLGWKDLFPPDQGRCTLLLGLPGSGKTLLLLKIAARMRLSEQTEVVLVSGDLSRPGPSQELALYSEILQIPIVQIFDLSELRNLTQEHSPQTHILVDWMGISPYSRDSWQPLEYFKQYHPHAQIILTASLASDLRGWQRLRSQFVGLPIVGLALTQADLEHRFGKIWEAVHGTDLPLVFLSTGKNVPGDFCEGSGFPFAQHLFQGYSHVSAATS